MIMFPNFDPVLVQIGPVAIRWYGMMYLLGFLCAWGLGRWRAMHSHGAWTSEQVSDLLFYGAVGLIIGARLGYMIFYYYPTQGFDDPLALFKTWEGGMSFHGGLLGVMVALVLFARREEKSVAAVYDFTAPLAPLGLFLGRMGNFINGELWGRVTDVPWGVVFPHVDFLTRHPSQLYEAMLEGGVLFICLWTFSSRPKPPWAVSGFFLVGYACARSLCELFREPDAPIGYFAGQLTMGQLLSAPLFILGVGLLWYAYNNQTVRDT